MTAQDHNKLLGILHLVQSGLQIVGGIMVAVIYGLLGAAFTANAHRQEERFMGELFVVLALIITPIILILGGINLIAGYKMLKEKSGARTWGIVASIICLIGFPLGTALGIYGLWFLFGDQGKSYYLGASPQNRQMFPPPPNQWQ